MILVDTSVWIDHLRSRSAILSAALERDEVVTHPFVIGELACGNLQRRSEMLSLLGKLPAAIPARHREALLFIERHHLMGKGIGYIDAHLLAAVFLTPGVRLWTRDKALAAIAAALRVDFNGG